MHHGVVTCKIVNRVKLSQVDHPAPSACPNDGLFFAASSRSQVLQGPLLPPGLPPRGEAHLALLRQRFWWSSMEEDTKGLIVACQICSQHKSTHQAPSVLLHPLPVPWSLVSLDFVTDLSSSDGNTVIFTVVDRLSKTAQFIALLKLPTAKETAEIMLKRVFCLQQSCL